MALDLADYQIEASKAVRAFWGNRAAALQQQDRLGKGDQGERGAVTAGKNMDGFVALISALVQGNGLADADIHPTRALLTLPGYFRPSKQWDVLVMHQGELVAAIELKSQVGMASRATRSGSTMPLLPWPKNLILLADISPVHVPMPMRYALLWLLLLLLLLLTLPTTAQPSDLEMRLFALPDVSFEAIDAPPGFAAAYELRIRQPLDHDDPSQGFFYQRVFLSHRGYDRPTVMATEGYARPQNRLYELTQLLDANQLDIEHRYFGESLPDSLDYRYLNMEQVAADLHHIREVFRQLYEGPWLSTGISKGGQTTIFYRYFYPDDVRVSVPYVAPLNLAYEEERIYTFLDTVGSEACREALYQVQKRLLQDRDEVLPRLRWYAKGAKLDFTYLSFEEAFEYAVLEYPFSFWQWGHACDQIPGRKADLETVLDHFMKVSGLDFFADQSMETYASHYYQAAAQLGYYGYETEPFEGLLQALPMQPHPHAAFTPGKVPVPYDGRLAAQVAEWLQTSGERFVYIYGASDTWSATAVQPIEGIDAEWFFLPGEDHGGARIRNFSPTQRERLQQALRRWLAE